MQKAPYDTIIIGGGPAGAAAAVYAARKKLQTLVICEEFGGQSLVSAKIENWIGKSPFPGRSWRRSWSGTSGPKKRWRSEPASDYRGEGQGGLHL